MHKLILLLFSLTISLPAFAALVTEFPDPEKPVLITAGTNPVLYLAANGEEGGRQPESGDLIIPGEEEKRVEEKQCLTVCKEWGEDCIINPRTGARKCRRTCKRFGEECF